MDNVVSVSRDEVVRLLGVSPDLDDATLHRKLAERLAQIEADKRASAVSAAEQRARAEDRRIVIAAVNDGRLTANRVEFWCEALQKDRAGNRAVIASLAAGLPPAEKIVADEEVERAHNKVLARLGIKPPAPRAKSPRAVEAAGQAPPSSPPVDMLGIPLLPQRPEPVRIFRGKDPATWTRQENSDWFMHRLGPRFSQGVNRPPRTDAFYRPSPNDTFEWVETGDGGEFRPKNSNEARRVFD